MGLFDLFKKKENKEAKKEVEQDLALTEQETALKEQEEHALAQLVEENALVEIKDKNVIAKITAVLPTIIDFSTFRQFKKMQEDLPELYTLPLKKGGHLERSQKTGMLLPFSRGEKGRIKEIAKPEQYIIEKTSTAAAEAMNLATAIVGQLYMQEIDRKLALLGEGVSKIISFLEIEYKSNVQSLIESVSTITKYQFVSVEREETRKEELAKLQRNRETCQTLLAQAENHVEKWITTPVEEYKDYVKAMVEIESWQNYQTTLVQLLYQINALDYALHKGEKPYEQCFYTFPKHEERVRELSMRLAEWHKKECETLKIDLEQNRRKHQGLLGYLEKPIGWINEKWNYLGVGEAEIKLIEKQSTPIQIEMGDKMEGLFEKDVEILVSGDKYYYINE